MPKAMAEEKAVKMLKKVGLISVCCTVRANFPAASVSAAAIARALVNEPKLLTGR